MTNKTSIRRQAKLAHVQAAKELMAADIWDSLKKVSSSKRHRMGKTPKVTFGKDALNPAFIRDSLCSMMAEAMASRPVMLAIERYTNYLLKRSMARLSVKDGKLIACVQVGDGDDSFVYIPVDSSGMIDREELGTLDAIIADLKRARATAE